MVAIGLQIRPILLILMLIASPIPPKELATIQNEEEGHFVWTVQSEDAWTSEERVGLEELGIRTLRQPTSNQLLVWSEIPVSLEGVVWAEWHGSSWDVHENVFRHRIVLEPRLPLDTVEDIIEMSSSIGSLGFERLVHPDLPLGTEFEIITNPSNLMVLKEFEGIRSVHPILETQGRDTVV